MHSQSRSYSVSRGAITILGMLLLYQVAHAATDKATDRHYTPAGFFDIHVCNWPNRPPFMKALFSTYRFNEISSVTVSDPDGDLLGHITFDQYRLLRQPGKPEKRVFMSDFDIPADATEGVYRALITLTDGRTFSAEDLVRLRKMPRATGMQPADGAELPDIPTELSWEPVPGARFYQVFLRDMWADGALVLESKLLNEPRLPVPPGLLERGGLYSWKVHARDVNEDPQTGDFNHGSINREATFTVAQ